MLPLWLLLRLWLLLLISAVAAVAINGDVDVVGPYDTTGILTNTTQHSTALYGKMSPHLSQQPTPQTLQQYSKNSK